MEVNENVFAGKKARFGVVFEFLPFSGDPGHREGTRVVDECRTPGPHAEGIGEVVLLTDVSRLSHMIVLDLCSAVMGIQ
jgi:hypothetical protein